MSAIPIGAKGSFAMTVTPEHLASRFKDPTLPPVLATPLMILFMENAALNAIRAYLVPGESALGTLVNVRHLAATPAGQRVTAEAVVTAVDGRRIVCKGARDSGRHRRRRVLCLLGLAWRFRIKVQIHPAARELLHTGR